MKDCSLGAQFYWRTVLLDLAAPPRRAPRGDSPVVCSGFGLDRSVYIGFRLFVLPKGCLGQCLRYAGGQQIESPPDRIDPTAFRLIQLRPARCSAVRRPDPTGP